MTHPGVLLPDHFYADDTRADSTKLDTACRLADAITRDDADGKDISFYVSWYNAKGKYAGKDVRAKTKKDAIDKIKKDYPGGTDYTAL